MRIVATIYKYFFFAVEFLKGVKKMGGVNILIFFGGPKNIFWRGSKTILFWGGGSVQKYFFGGLSYISLERVQNKRGGGGVEDQ